MTDAERVVVVLVERAVSRAFGAHQQWRGASRPDKQIVSLGGNVLEPLWPWLGVCVYVGGVGLG